MSEKKQTRSVFAAITSPACKSILIYQRVDGTGWSLPGGQVEGPDERADLVRQVEEQTGLVVEVIEQLGPSHASEGPDRIDTATSYICKAVGGKELPTTFYITKMYVLQETAADGPYRLVDSDRERLQRMMLDGLSILEEATGPDWDAPEGQIGVSENKCFLIKSTGTVRLSWPRLDPYSPSGRMEPASAPAS